MTLNVTCLLFACFCALCAFYWTYLDLSAAPSCSSTLAKLLNVTRDAVSARLGLRLFYLMPRCSELTIKLLDGDYYCYYYFIIVYRLTDMDNWSKCVHEPECVHFVPFIDCTLTRCRCEVQSMHASRELVDWVLAVRALQFKCHSMQFLLFVTPP